MDDSFSSASPIVAAPVFCFSTILAENLKTLTIALDDLQHAADRMVSGVTESVLNATFAASSSVLSGNSSMPSLLPLESEEEVGENSSRHGLIGDAQGLDFAESESTATSLGPLAFVSSGDEDGDEEEIDPYDEEYKPYKFRPGARRKRTLQPASGLRPAAGPKRSRLAMATAQFESKSTEAATTKTSGRAGVPHSPPAAINLGTDPFASLLALRPAVLPAAKATLLGVTRPVFFRTELTPAGDDWDEYGGSLKYIPEEIVEPYDAADSDQDEWDVPGDFELRNCTRTCFSISQSEILYTKRSVIAPYALQRTHAISVDEIARRVGYPECQTSWAINEMLRFSKQRFFNSTLKSTLESRGIRVPEGRVMFRNTLSRFCEGETREMYNSFRKQFRPLFPMQALRESVARGFQEETPSTTNETPEAATQQQEQFKQLVVNKFCTTMRSLAANLRLNDSDYGLASHSFGSDLFVFHSRLLHDAVAPLAAQQSPGSRPEGQQLFDPASQPPFNDVTQNAAPTHISPQ